MINELLELDSSSESARFLAPVTIETEQDTYRLDIPKGSVILYEALRVGIPLAYSCASGTCGTCVARVTEGEVEDLWQDAPGLSAKLRQAGRILSCQSVVAAPLRLRANQGAACTRPLLPLPDYFSGRLVKSVCHAPGVTELQLQVDRAFSFIPGQFILVWFDGLSGPRALSISNADRSPVDQIRLLVKPRKGGEFDALLRSTNANGVPLRVFGPLGSACLFDDTIHSEITCVAGSTGIAPMLSILYDWVRRGAPCTARLIYGVRTSEDAVLLDEVADIAQRSAGQLNVVIALSEPRDDDVRDLQQQVKNFGRVVTGYAHDAARELASDSPLSGIAFVSGPKPMVQATVKTLIVHGKLSPTAIRSDDFG
jgi:toluene monooxygenase electron transfer component